MHGYANLGQLLVMGTFCYVWAKKANKFFLYPEL
tara:strand:- start:317 stop:418 length:102 start_codon:yes stop_codon:yes gene_type:complete